MYLLLVYLMKQKQHLLWKPPYCNMVLFPKGPCTQIVYTLALKESLYRYIGAKLYTIWVHGPLGFGCSYLKFRVVVWSVVS